MSSKKLIIVDKDSAGIRLDKFLKEQLTIPFSLIQREIRKKNIKVNKKKSSSNYRLLEADQIVVFKEYTTNVDKNIDITVPDGLYSLDGEFEELSGTDDYVFNLNDNANITDDKDGILQNKTIERKLMRGIEVNVDRTEAM